MLHVWTECPCFITLGYEISSKAKNYTGRIVFQAPFGLLKAPFTRERNGTDQSGPERNGTELLRGVHMAMDRFEVLISSSLETKIF